MKTSRSYLMLGMSLALLLSGRFSNFEAQKSILFSGVSCPKRKILSLVVFLWTRWFGGTRWDGHASRQADDTEFYYYIHYINIAANEFITLNRTTHLFLTQILDVRAL